MKSMEKLHPNEIQLVGNWKQIEGKVVADETCQRIQWLVDQILEKVGTDKTGWEHLYRDSETGSLWELTYPHSDWHGGGPPALRRVSSAEIASKYHIRKQ